MSSLGDQDYQLYEQIVNLITDLYKKQEAQAFIRLPLKSTPGYYDAIKDPISINDVKRKLTKEQSYKNIAQIQQDFQLIFDNCREYNQEGSKIVDYAEYIERHVKKAFKRMDQNQDIVYPRKKQTTRKSKASRLTKDNLSRLNPKSNRASKRATSSRASSARKSSNKSKMDRKNDHQIQSDEQYLKASLAFVSIFLKLKDDHQDKILKRNMKIDENGSVELTKQLIEKLEKKYQFGLF